MQSLIKKLFIVKKSSPFKIYNNTIYPKLVDALTNYFIQPLKSVNRIHRYKKLYNPKYRFAYTIFDFVNYDIQMNSIIASDIDQTEYTTLMSRVSQDSAGADKVIYVMKELIEKGKKHGLLSIQINQLAYLLEPYEISWQGNYLASLKD